MILIGGSLLLAATAFLSPLQQRFAGQDQTPVIRRLAATAQLAAQEYRNGVANGRVVAPAEVAEARLFLQESRRSAALLPAGSSTTVLREIDNLLHMVDRVAAPDSIDVRVRQLASSLVKQFGVTLDELPALAPSLAHGAAVYRSNCAGCHGGFGRGDGPLAASLEPRPANLTDAEALRDQSPLDYYRRISIGVAGTAMPAFEARLPAADRWAAALYASLLHLPPPAGKVPPALQAFPTSGRMSDAALLAALPKSDSTSHALAQVAAVRAFQPDASTSNNDQVFALVRAQVESTYALARKGDTSASTRAFDAYMTFEQVERSVRAKNPGLAAELEASFAALRTRAAGGATASELDGIRRQLDAGLENAERVLGDDLSPANLFLQSLVILVREGLEAILIVGALMTFLVKMGAGQRKRDINIGVAAAVIASLLTAFALETVFQLTPAKREALEGFTMVAATGVLFYVSYWLLSKMEVVKWNHFVKSKVQDALTSGSSLALASAAFLAVYREGFETVLFYKALFLSGGPSGGAMPIVLGILLGSVVMVGVYIAINRFGLRLPLKPFFGVTSAFLYYMAFVFAGKGVAELQDGGTLPTTIVLGAPRLPALGIYPTVESLLLQGVLLLLLIIALVWTFVLAPRRARARRTTPESVRSRSVSVAVPPPVPQGASLDLLRSLERMEADLGEMRAEVERMKANLTEAPESRARKS
ncbi:MAG TPA: FTR1 family protein [Gemmatimonadales bacterium]|jgi:high-affinity iron transporter|nr:FTR1 family protein [Gemmatimonadales bacterium]